MSGEVKSQNTRRVLLNVSNNEKVERLLNSNNRNKSGLINRILDQHFNQVSKTKRKEAVKHD